MKNLKSKKLYLQVYDELRSYIQRTEMKPGDKLPTEMELSEELGVSRNVLREAIKTLEILGIVTSKPGTGMVVNAFSPSSLSTCMFLSLVEDPGDLWAQSQEVRMNLEIVFARKCFDSITPAQLRIMHGCLKHMETSSNYKEGFKWDAKFHKAMYQNIDNKILIAILNSAWEFEESVRTESISDNELRLEKHTKIYNALKEHDYDAFLDSLDYHFNYKYKTDSIELKKTKKS